MRRQARCVAGILTGMGLVSTAAGQAQSFSDPLAELSRMSLEELSRVEVTSVSKSAQRLSSAPASIYVITRAEILRSGVLSIPEALRLAPNMQVAQINSQEYQIGARGFGGQLELQNFSNKILILIDGRSVYNPLFSGVVYDALDVVMDDIERIEVISGPGATLWGANAMNGVINIITRSARDTTGALVRATVGDRENAVSARYGADFASGAWRAYAKAFDRGPSELPDGASAGNRWNKVQAGFRSDFGDGPHQFTVLGDWQSANQNLGAADVNFRQMDLLGRWEHSGARATSRVQVYVDHQRRDQPPQGVGLELTTYDVEFQQSLRAGSRHAIVWGLGRRFNDYEVENTPTLSVQPPGRGLSLTNVFAQDTITLGDHFNLTAGVKFERNSFSGWSTLPDLRLAWTPDDRTVIWTKAARAIRSPTPFDVDVVERIDGVNPFLVGNADFRTEKVDAFEMGYRSQPHASVSWSLSAFYNEYDDLRSIEVTPVTFLPLRWGNGMEGHTYGVDVWAEWQVAPWWRLSPGFRWLHKSLEFSAGSSGIGGVAQAGNDPKARGALKSSMSWRRITFDTMLRYVDELPEPANPDYYELNARLGWKMSDALELSVSGFNLLESRHYEYPAPTGQAIRRSVHADIRWNF